MKEDLQRAINLWWESWEISRKKNDYDFENELINNFPEYKFTYDIFNENWIVL